MGTRPKWGKPIEHEGATYYARSVYVDPTGTVVDVNGKLFFALAYDVKKAEERRQRAQEMVKDLRERLECDDD